MGGGCFPAGSPIRYHDPRARLFELRCILTRRQWIPIRSHVKPWPQSLTIDIFRDSRHHADDHDGPRGADHSAQFSKDRTERTGATTPFHVLTHVLPTTWTHVSRSWGLACSGTANGAKSRYVGSDLHRCATTHPEADSPVPLQAACRPLLNSITADQS